MGQLIERGTRVTVWGRNTPYGARLPQGTARVVNVITRPGETEQRALLAWDDGSISTALPLSMLEPIADTAVSATPGGPDAHEVPTDA